MDKEVQEKVVQLQNMETRLNGLVMQRQAFQSQLFEIENALTELKDASESYKVVGQVMCACDKATLEKDLKGKQKLIETSSANLEKEEIKLKEQFEKLQEEVMKEIENESTKKRSS